MHNNRNYPKWKPENNMIGNKQSYEKLSSNFTYVLSEVPKWVGEGKENYSQK